MMNKGLLNLARTIWQDMTILHQLHDLWSTPCLLLLLATIEILRIFEIGDFFFLLCLLSALKSEGFVNFECFA